MLETCCIPVVKEHIPTVFEEGQAVAPAPFSSTVVVDPRRLPLRGLPLRALLSRLLYLSLHQSQLTLSLPKCGPKETRTPDLLIANEAHYQLCYGPEKPYTTASKERS